MTTTRLGWLDDWVRASPEGPVGYSQYALVMGTQSSLSGLKQIAENFNADYDRQVSEAPLHLAKREGQCWVFLCRS